MWLPLSSFLVLYWATFSKNFKNLRTHFWYLFSSFDQSHATMHSCKYTCNSQTTHRKSVATVANLLRNRFFDLQFKNITSRIEWISIRNMISKDMNRIAVHSITWQVVSVFGQLPMCQRFKIETGGPKRGPRFSLTIQPRVATALMKYLKKIESSANRSDRDVGCLFLM